MVKGKHWARVLGALLIAGAATGASATAASAATLSGAGSTLVAPLEQEWASAFEANNSSATITYQAVGSGQGLKDIAAGQVDFGASDAPLSASPVQCNGCVQMPWALSATGLGFHINGVKSLHLTGNVIAQIYLGIIKNWNDPRIQKLQKKGVHLPNLPITVFFRSDGSGDTYAFTDYESQVSGAFKNRIGSATTVSWPTGVGAKGNSGMVQSLAATNGGIAYVAVWYLIADWPYAVAIRNQAGNWEVPNFNNIKNAAQAFTHLGAGNEIHIVNPPAPQCADRLPDLHLHLRGRADQCSSGFAAKELHRLRDQWWTSVGTTARLRADPAVHPPGGPGHPKPGSLTRPIEKSNGALVRPLKGARPSPQVMTSDRAACKPQIREELFPI